MKILAPISRISELEPLIKAGVDEVYCGVLSGQWLARYTNIASVNRVDRQNGNVGDYGELREIVSTAHRHAVKVNCALNGLYTPEQAGDLRAELDKALESGVDALIIADVGLLREVRDKISGLQIHASTGTTVFNAQSVSFLKKLGVSRIILPRSLNKEELFRLVKNHPHSEFEIFALNGRCQNIDGFCTFQHGIADLRTPRLNAFLISSPFGYRLQNALLSSATLRRWMMRLWGGRVCATACSIPYASKISAADGDHEAKLPRPDYIDALYSCAGCDVADFISWGVAAVKIVGRTFPLERKLRDVRYLKTLIDAAAKAGIERDDFSAFAIKTYEAVYGGPCRHNCYYPEPWP